METNLYFEQYGDLRFAVFEISNEVEVDNFSLEIIRRNKVNGLLGCTTIQNNNEKIIKYNIENMVSLSNLIKESITESKIIELLLNIFRTLNSLEDYMLSQNLVILDTDFIFIDFEQGKTGLIYTPIESNNIKSKNLTRFLKEVVLDLKIENKSDYSFFNKIVSFLSDNRDSSIKSIIDFLSEFKRKQTIEVDDEYKKENACDDFEIKKDLIQNKPSTYIPIDLIQMEDLNSPFRPSNIASADVQRVKRLSIFSFFYKKKRNKKNNFDKELSSFHSVLNQHLPSKQISPESFNNKTPPCNTNSSFPSSQNEGTTVLNLQVAPGTTILNYANQPFITRKKSGERFYLSNEKCTIGTDKKMSTIFISNNSTISRSHATLTKKKGMVFIQDNCSTNGTYINSQKLTKGSANKLIHGDSITISNEDFEFKTY